VTIDAGREPAMTTSSAPWCDFGGHVSHAKPRVFDVRGPDDLREVLSRAAAAGRPVRVRGNGHAMNGLALPRRGEWLLQMQGCDRYRFECPRTVTAGAGIAVWDLHRELRRRGLGLRVFNDGGAAASSLGGFLSAGGFGESSARHGGFWESVESVTLVDAQGEMHVLDRAHPDFRWLFGAMGQLGVACELRLRLEDAGADAPVGEGGQVMATHPPWAPMRWYSLFVPEEDGLVAYRALRELGACHRSAWLGRWPYAYALPFRSFNPPLLTPHDGPLAAVGIWGDRPASGFDEAALRRIDRGIATLVARHPRWRRYIQSERTPRGFDFAAHFGAETFAAWREVKRRYDPQLRLARGVFRD